MKVTRRLSSAIVGAMMGDQTTGASDPGSPDYALAWLGAPERLLDEVRRDPDSVERQFRSLDATHEFRAHSFMDIEALTLAVVEPQTQCLVFSANADEAAILRAIDWEQAEAALRGGTMKLVQAAAEHSDAALWTYVAAREALTWKLPDAVHRALADATGRRVLVATTFAASVGPLLRACAAFGLTGLETRVVEATLRMGSIRAGAVAGGLSYATAREAISVALAKVGVARMPGLLHRLSLQAFGLFPNADEALDLLTDRWGLKPRQAQIAMLLAQGMTRNETARALGLSEATVKKQADIAFQTLGVTSAAEAARSVSAMTAMQALADASHGRLAWADGNAEPLRFILRPDGGRIAISEYGLGSGRPVVIVHSSMTSRHPPRKLVARLLQEGFRVIAIDRPGFGLTDMEEVDDADRRRADPFEAAAHDMKIVLDSLRIGQVDMIGRGGAQAVVAFAGLYPQHCGQVILVNPDPLSARDDRRWGVLGSFKEAYLRRPELILPAARLISRAMTRPYLAKALRKAMRGSPPDEALLADDGVIDDYYRAVRMSRAGHIEGYVREQAYFALGQAKDYAVDGRSWRVLIGAHDTLSDPANALSYWRELLPRADFEIVKDHGRFLAYANPGLIVERLLGRG